jgi:succinoglycan biosynthesis transport protein ExoP
MHGCPQTAGSQMEKKVTSQKGRTVQEDLRIIWKRRWAALAVFSIVVISSALHTFTAVPIYRATVQILIERQTPRLLDQREASPGYDYYGEEFYQTQYKLLEGRALAKKVADKLKLREHPYFTAIFAELSADASPGAKERAEESLVEAVASGVEVHPIRNSRLVNVSFSHSDPRFSALMVNTLARCYIDQSLDLRFATSQEEAFWLQQKLADARKKLEVSEANLNRYKREQNIVALEDRESITAQKLEQLNKELVTAQTRRMESETRFKEVSQGKPIPQVLNNALIQTLKSQEAKIIAEHSELARKYGEKHPRMIQLENELAATRTKINGETNFVVQSIKNEYTMALAQEENLKKALDDQKDLTQDLGDRAIQYRVLLRDVETNRALYENVLKSLKTTTATENLPATNIRIVYPAAVPEVPISPRKTRNLVLAVIIGTVLGTGLAMVLERLDTTLKTQEEVETWVEVPNLAIIPRLEKVNPGNPEDLPELVVSHETQPLAAEAYRGLRTSILFSTPERSPRIVLVTSSVPLEGKTLTSSNLAGAMAQAEAKVLLVDADLRRPSLHKLFQVAVEPGLSNFLVGEIDEVPTCATPIPHLFLVPAGKIPPNPSELLGSKRMRDFLERAQAEYTRIILDSPPLNSVTDGTILAAQSEGVLLVVRAETVPRKMVLEARDRLLEIKAPLLGVVLNCVNLKRDGRYHYAYRYHYLGDHQEEGSSSRQRGDEAKESAWLSRLKERFGNRPGNSA